MTRAHWTRLREYLRLEMAKAHARADLANRRSADCTARDASSVFVIEAKEHRAKAAALFAVGEKMSRIVRVHMTREQGRRRGGRREP